MTSTETNPVDNQPMHVVSGETSWRLVHSNGVARALFQSSAITRTKHSVFTAATRQACLDEATSLGLDMSAIQ